MLRSAGAEIVQFSPLHDDALPKDISGIYLGGGYPELYASQLSCNQNMREQIQQAHLKDVPIYAECGGLMVLTQSLTDLDGKTHPMFGLIPGHSRMLDRLQIGYRLITACQDSILLQQGQRTRGHEFHYSDWLDYPANVDHAYDISPRIGHDTRPEGFVKNNLLASYTHLHFGSQPVMARNFVNKCNQWVSA